jgi:hypothetical protein
MLALLYSRADNALSLRHQELVGLGKFRLPQPIKRIIEMDLKRAAPWRPVSHAF